MIAFILLLILLVLLAAGITIGGEMAMKEIDALKQDGSQGEWIEGNNE